ncbi:transcriptional regulator [Streptococcus dysgalactiae]|uniref:Transcriptional regulator n=1 Tax=Streptococcus dysgalactiae TaxID=1334 RepID=A0AAE9UM51_STRDY|nr:transcriptional regulator [Streptococcus dysgalactiae]HES3276644.1 transcriptional regulator [Streptococcus pyogenes]MEC4578036.1 transcriptional regulator [Streptococcus dysgalactiae]QGH05107.1 transcriptional regulator [Streptococcus dysgalactiae subsp. dysgalactiae]WAI93198.1 transcriptional regulator [Streptococcus dysgalactiae]WCE86297.1 transcriptional regulator [Streptococcus dysgalactiae]
MNNAFLQDTNLSLQAKGLLAEILSNKGDWRIYIGELESRSTNGRDAHRKAYRELQEASYIKIVRRSDGKTGVKKFVFAQDIPIKQVHLDYYESLVDRELSTVLSDEENPTY